MNREQKAEYVDALSARLKESPFVALADYRGVEVAEINQFRRTLEAQGIEYRVIKNTLAKRAIAGTDLEGLGDHLAGMTGWVLSGEDPSACAKLLKDATKELNKAEKFVLKAGYLDGQILVGPDEVKKVADMPSKEELLVMLLRTLQEGPRRILGVIRGPARDLLYLLKNYERKLEAGAPADE